MSKQMTVKEFIKKYDVLTSKELKDNLLKSVVKNIYVAYEHKVAICEKIVESSYYVKIKDKDDKERKKMHINSPINYMLYCLNIVNNYTNIEIDFTNSLEEFNLLNGSECLDIIYSYIPERELKEFRMILDMVESDVIQNEYETHAFINNQIERFGNIAGVVLSPLLEQLAHGVDNLDEKTVDKLVKGLGKLVKASGIK